MDHLELYGPWLYIIPVAPSGILIRGILEWQHYYVLVILLIENWNWAPFCKTVPVKNRDLVFINCSQTYHRSLVFLGNRVNLIFYNSIIERKDMTIVSFPDLQ
jgi:hypothetical protein